MIWRPLVQGELAGRCFEAVQEIAGELASFSPPEGPRFPSLAGGAAGEAVFATYLALHTGNDALVDRASGLLDQAAEALATSVAPPGLFSGIAGIAWAVEHVQARVFAADPEDEDANADIDEALLAYLSAPAADDEYDLVRGLTGIGVYARERLNRPTGRALLETVIDRLARLAETAPEGYTWFSPPERLPDWQREISPRGLYNLGVAHGIPAVVALLGAACQSRVGVGKARPLLQGTVRWLLAHELPAGHGSCFANTFGPGIAPGPSRLAWCYGDPGIAATLQVAARAASEPAWGAKALEIARSAARRPPELALVRDAGLCHGSAGLAHLFNRLWQGTGDETLRDAALFWIERTLEYRVPGEGIAGFRAWHALEGPEGEWVAEPGLLEGATGIGLVLLAAVSAIDPEWDRILLAS